MNHNYLNLKENEVICPCCGEILKTKTHTCTYTGMGDEPDYYETHSYDTAKCQKCNIKLNTHHFDKSDARAWDIPKSILENVNVTAKQIGYFQFLTSKIKKYEKAQCICSKSLLSQIIQQYEDEYIKKLINELSVKRNENVFEKLGYQKYFDNNKLFIFNDNKFRHEITVDENFNIINNKYEFINASDEDIFAYLQLAKENINIINIEIKENEENYITIDDAKREFIEQKQSYLRFKENRCYDDYDDYDGMSMFDTF